MNIGVSIPLPAYKVDPGLHRAHRGGARLRVAVVCRASHHARAQQQPVPGLRRRRHPGELLALRRPLRGAGARVSGTTTRLKLGTGITLVPERNPLLLAKEISTLDLFSGGRFLFGIGTGWHREETTIMGGDFDHRWTQTREAILVMKELWTKTEAEYHGKYYDFPPGPLVSEARPEAASPRHPRRPRQDGARAHRRVGRRVAAQSHHAGGCCGGAVQARHARQASRA